MTDPTTRRAEAIATLGGVEKAREFVKLMASGQLVAPSRQTTALAELAELAIDAPSSLTAALESAKGYQMSDEEREAQRKSWVRGEIALGLDRNTTSGPMQAAERLRQVEQERDAAVKRAEAAERIKDIARRSLERRFEAGRRELPSESEREKFLHAWTAIADQHMDAPRGSKMRDLIDNADAYFKHLAAENNTLRERIVTAAVEAAQPQPAATSERVQKLRGDIMRDGGIIYSRDLDELCALASAPRAPEPAGDALREAVAAGEAKELREKLAEAEERADLKERCAAQCAEWYLGAMKELDLVEAEYRKTWAIEDATRPPAVELMRRAAASADILRKRASNMEQQLAAARADARKLAVEELKRVAVELDTSLSYNADSLGELCSAVRGDLVRIRETIAALESQEKPEATTSRSSRQPLNGARRPTGAEE